MARFLLGNEALAQGALDAGINGCYGYPGTPSTEIMDYIRGAPETPTRQIHAQWSTNEEAALTEALGMSYAGRRSLVCMRHGGLNVAADGLMHAAVTGINGGLVVAVVDDPAMQAAQNGQDSRFYAKLAHLPCLEPGNQQETYQAMVYAMNLSEECLVPVLIRLTSRLAQSRATVITGAVSAQNPLRPPSHPERFLLLPATARQNESALLEKQVDFMRRSEDSGFNHFFDGRDHSVGILTSGCAINCVRECYPQGVCPHPILKISQYPVPRHLVQRLMELCTRVLVLEDGEPFIEEAMLGLLGKRDKITGRLDGAVPRTGELTTERVAKALNIPTRERRESGYTVPARPPRRCDGCPHTDTFKALQEVLRDSGPGHVFSDMGCCMLGAPSPFTLISTCMNRGASIAMAKGAADAGLQPVVAIIGDATFTHAGIPPLLDAVAQSTRLTVVILDNGGAALSGGQGVPGTGHSESVCSGLGIAKDHLRVVVPLPKHHAENVAVLKDAIFTQHGVSVVIARRDCQQNARSRKA